MRSSTFNFECESIPLPWLRISFWAFLVFASFLSVIELRLAAKGFRPTVVDSETLWLRERERAAALGQGALIIVGASRIQLGLDLDLLRQSTGLEPVELAIDGALPLPVLEGLAGDPGVTGTVVVDYYDYMLSGEATRTLASRLEDHYQKTGAVDRGSDLERLEAYLVDRFRRPLRAYADGAMPLDSLLLRVFNREATPQYLVTLPDRSRMADYRRVKMPEFYLSRVMRELGQEVELPDGANAEYWEQALRARIETLARQDNSEFLGRLAYLEELVQAIQGRGGKVVFVAMPTSGLVREMENRRYPRSEFWDRLAARTSAEKVHFEDLPGLDNLSCPDGSHLDYRDRSRFTAALLVALGYRPASKDTSRI